MKQKGSERYLRLRELAYWLWQGASKGRDEGYTRAHGGFHNQFLCALLTSSEKAIRDLARAEGMERQPGEALRLIDVPASLDGRDHIFDRLGSDPSQERKAEIFKEIVAACEANHGAAGDMFISRLISHRDKVAAYLKEAEASFVKEVAYELDGDVARDVAGTFGLIYAAGMIGIKTKLLPWGREELFDAIAKCYRAARDLLPDDGVTLRQGIDKLRSLLGSLPMRSDLQSSGEWSAAPGYRVRIEDVHQCVVRREVFNSAFASREQAGLVVEWLIGQDRMAKALPTGQADSSPKAQTIWPDRKRRRSYEIAWPAKP
jgi:putative DNA primase/helicase